MTWIWWAVGGAFLLGGTVGVVVMALLTASRADRDSDRDRDPEAGE